MIIYLRYILEFAVIVPSALISFFSSEKYFACSKKKVYFFVISMLCVLVFGGAFICTLFGINASMANLPIILLCYLPYHFCIDLKISKKIFLYMNAVMLSVFSIMYGDFLIAPLEAASSEKVLGIMAGMICVGVSMITSAVHLPVFYSKIPYLFENEFFQRMWKRLWMIPTAVSFLYIWSTPVSVQTLMVRRVRIVSLVIFIYFPIAVWAMYSIFFWIAKRAEEHSKLRIENNYLQLEEKRYDYFLEYIEKTSAMRHDFRHHLMMINEYANGGELLKLREYLSQFDIAYIENYKKYSGNRALDIIAAHYDDIAKKENIGIDWYIDIEKDIPFKESDICALIGNLLENAVNAVRKLQKELRKINVIAKMTSETIMAVIVSNPYTGDISLDKNGIPKAKEAGHGYGLRSVESIVNLYNGALNFEVTENFTVKIILNGIW